nr:Crp/Fnr family transcriptional regulator [Haematobacter sp. UBA3484]
MTVSCTACPLRRRPAFLPMTSEELRFMERFKRGEMIVSPGTPLFSEGEQSRNMYTVLSGMGLKYKSLEDGRRQVVNFVFPGDFVGLQNAISAGMQFGIEATTPMTLCVFDRSRLGELFTTQPTRAYSLTWISAAEEYFLGDALATIGQRDARERLAWAMARIFGRLTALGLAEGQTVPFPYRQQDLADAVGLSLVHTNKMLARLRLDGLADWAGGRLTVPDVQRLGAAAMMDELIPPPRPIF